MSAAVRSGRARGNSRLMCGCPRASRQTSSPRPNCARSSTDSPHPTCRPAGATISPCALLALDRRDIGCLRLARPEEVGAARGRGLTRMTVERKGRTEPLSRVLSGAMPRGLQGRRHLRAPAGAHDHGGRQHLVHAAHDEPAPAACRRGVRAKTEFGRPLVNSCLTLAIVTGMSVSDLSQKAIANLGWDKVRMTAPVFAGDTIYAESEVLDVRESKSRPNAGHRHGAHARQKGRRHRLHDLRALDPRARGQTRSRGRRVCMAARGTR
jgi:hypothetical protein